MAYDSEIRLYSNIPLDPRYEHTLYWGTIERQNNYFGTSGGKLVHRFTDFSYLRKERSVKIPVHLEELDDTINYCAMRNNGGKWRYYFVLDKVYKSQSTCELIVELDVMQTYQFDWNIPACFVEREHVDNDTPGEHLVEEGLELGDLIVNDGSAIHTPLLELMIVIQSSVAMIAGDNVSLGDPVRGAMMGGVYSGFRLYCVPATDAGVQILETCLSQLDALGKTDGIQSMWMYPRYLIDYVNTGSICPIRGMLHIEWTGQKISTLDGYTPRNKKLLTYPFCYIYVYNNSGQGAKYRNEFFSDATPTLRIGGSLGNDGVVRLVPANYRGYAHDNESGISLSGYPTCAWNQDLYKIWMAQNANTQALHLEQAGVQGVASGAAGLVSLFTGNLGGAASGAMGVVNSYYAQKEIMAQRSDKDVQPPQSRGVQSSSCNIALGIQSFTLSLMTVRNDYARRLDSYFDMYGYQVNMVKTPNMENRPLWNFVKTSGCVVLGNIDAADRRKIGAIFDNGVTLWKAPETMYRYDLAAGNVDV